MKKWLSKNRKKAIQTILASVVLISSIVIMNGCDIMKKEVDLIVTNAKVYTVDDLFSVKNTFVVKDGRFEDVGDERLLDKYNANRIIDLQGKPVYPGFIDGHCHFYWYGVNLRDADLTGSQSFEEILDILE
ncbi:MAG: amidohydrolase family protein, partial [Bacteroidota bacterium]